jgi:transcriptional regulator with XRE-family HTH domain
MVLSAFGANLKRARQAKGWTQAELAKRAQVRQGYLSELELGQKTNPSMALLERLARALGTSVSRLMK